MKKLTALLLSVVLVLSLAACGSANKPAYAQKMMELTSSAQNDND